MSWWGGWLRVLKPEVDINIYCLNSWACCMRRSTIGYNFSVISIPSFPTAKTVRMWTSRGKFQEWRQKARHKAGYQSRKKIDREVSFLFPRTQIKWVPKFPTTRPFKAVIVLRSCGWFEFGPNFYSSLLVLTHHPPSLSPLSQLQQTYKPFLLPLPPNREKRKIK
jgi:hypothetical protein